MNLNIKVCFELAAINGYDLLRYNWEWSSKKFRTATARSVLPWPCSYSGPSPFWIFYYWASWTRWSETVIFAVFFVALRDLSRLDPALIEALAFSHLPFSTGVFSFKSEVRQRFCRNIIWEGFIFQGQSNNVLSFRQGQIFAQNMDLAEWCYERVFNFITW